MDFSIGSLTITYFHTGNPHYHWRGVVSRSCSGWEGVGPTRYGHQAKRVVPLAVPRHQSGRSSLLCSYRFGLSCIGHMSTDCFTHLARLGGGLFLWPSYTQTHWL